METSTTFNKHWAINTIPRTQKLNKGQYEIILDSIIIGIKHRLKKLSGESNLLENNAIIDVLEDNNNEFESPKFNNDFSTFDSNKYFTQSQKWIGHVEQINKEGFIAKLTDLSNPTTYEMGEFDFDEVSPGDMELVTIGAAFYWSLGRAYNNGQIEKKSILRFQRVRSWNEDDYDRVLDRAEEKFQKLKWK